MTQRKHRPNNPKYPHLDSPVNAPKAKFISWGVVIGSLLLFFVFYNFGRITPHEMVKTTGLEAITLLSITLVVGPLARFIPSFEAFKPHRKFWGIISFLFLVAHFTLVVVYYFRLNFLALVDPTRPKFTGTIMGLGAFLILFGLAGTSNRLAFTKLGPKVWKAIQTTGYLALILAILHFYFMEQVNGILVIKRLLGRITLLFTVAVVLLRLTVWLLPERTRDK